jgi:hypothetical protein
MSSRKKTVLILECLSSDEPTSLTAGKEVLMDVDITFDDGALARARGLSAGKSYCVSGQIRTREVSDGYAWNSIIGGWGARMELVEAKRFSQATLDKLQVHNEAVIRIVNRTLEVSGQQLSPKGSQVLSDYLKASV